MNLQQINALAMVREYLEFDHVSGHFYWKKKVNRRTVVGSRVGHYEPDRYVALVIFGCRFYAHRLAWFFFYGELPSLQIDHINRDKQDNRISNLRQATNAQNHQNLVKRGTSGIKGVNKSFNKWYARVTVNGNNHLLGSFLTKEAAAAAYEAKARELHGEFYCGGQYVPAA